MANPPSAIAVKSIACGAANISEQIGRACRFRLSWFDEHVEGEIILMLRKRFHANSVAGIILTASAIGLAQTRTPSAVKTGYAPVNGLQLYYEIHGTGKPLILLHGGLGSIEMMGELLPLLSAGRQVIAVDLQAHGRTADIERPMRCEAMADDIAALLKHLGIAKADVMGYSLGGGVALRTVIQYPEMVRKLVLVSTPCRRDGWYPEPPLRSK
jgi:hypothetical protein